MTERPGRARPLSREERRAAIVKATVPLLLEYGATATTRQIAQAAGVAEGTLFRAFADKDEILHAAVTSVLDPRPMAEELRAVPEGLSLHDTVTHLVLVLTARQQLAMRVLGAAHQLLRSPHGHDAAADTGAKGHREQHHDARSKAMQALLDAVAEHLVHYGEDLRLDPGKSARILFSIVMGSSMPIVVGDKDRLTTDEIVDAVLHGVAAPVGAPLPVPVGAGPPR